MCRNKKRKPLVGASHSWLINDCSIEKAVACNDRALITNARWPIGLDSDHRWTSSFLTDKSSNLVVVHQVQTSSPTTKFPHVVDCGNKRLHLHELPVETSVVVKRRNQLSNRIERQMLTQKGSATASERGDYLSHTLKREFGYQCLGDE